MGIAVKPSIPVSGDPGRYTMAQGRAAIARVSWHLPEDRGDISAHYQLRDLNTVMVVAITRLNEPVITERFDEAEHPLTGSALDDFAQAGLQAA